MKLIAWTITRDEQYGFDIVREGVSVPQGAGMKAEQLGLVLTLVGADVESLAAALEEIAQELREEGLEALYGGAEFPSAA